MEGFQKAFRIAMYNRKTFFLIACMRTVCNLMMIGNALIFGELINMVARGEEIRRVGIAVALAGAYSLVWCVLRWLTYLGMQKYIVRVSRAYRNQYLHALLGAKFNAVSKEDSSTYINSITDDIDKMVDISVFHCADLIGCILSVVASFGAALFLRWEIALTMVGFTVIMAILPFFIKKRLEDSMVQRSKNRGTYIGILKENLLGLSIIKSYGGENQCFGRIAEKDDAYVASIYRNIRINTVAGELSNTIRQIALVTLIAATCYCVYLQRVEVGAVLSVFSIGQSFYGYIMYASAIFTSIFSVNGIIRKVGKVLDLPVSEYTQDIPYEKELRLDDVRFAYAGEERKQVLNGISLVFERNKKYLILGASGSGKSTVIKLIAKLYDDYQGQITVDGKDYAAYSEKDISHIISVSQQDGYLFNRTLRDNIDFLGEGDEARLHDVIEQCMLTDFVQGLPNGLDTVLDEEVNQVSGGEKLRINLARAVYKQSKILLLDEVTSALDKSTSDKVERNILAIDDRTIINVCHKFHDGTLQQYDEIVIIEDGQVVLKGSFEQLHAEEKLAQYRNLDEN